MLLTAEAAVLLPGNRDAPVPGLADSNPRAFGLESRFGFSNNA